MTGIDFYRTQKTGLQSGSYEPDCRPAALFSCDLAKFTGNPSDLTSDLHRLPAVEGTGHILQRCARGDGGNTAVAGAVARADVDPAARGLDVIMIHLADGRNTVEA